jgi:hypothetical protein
MAKKLVLGFDERYVGCFAFGDSTVETHIAYQIASLATTWGRLEYSLFLILEATNPSKAQKWNCEFFGVVQWEKRSRACRKQYSMPLPTGRLLAPR